MKFSVLLPTKDRLEYLKSAVETVRRQEFDDWELIIFDNFSAESARDFATSLEDPRIKYFRTDRPVPVTENWNNALYASSGDYVIMLGDDDGLMPDYLGRAARLIERFEGPDVLYTSAYLYAYPRATLERPEGSLHTYGYATFLRDAREPFVLDPATAAEVARQTMDFRVRYGFNMQFATIRRGFIDSLAHKGPFFQSPFPDYYAMNVAFLKASRIVVCPEKMVALGISPKSYGSFLNRNVESEGVQFLEARSEVLGYSSLDGVVLPGTNVNTSWLYSIETIKANYGRELGLRVSYNRYRFLQTVYVYKNYYITKKLPYAEVVRLWRKLHLWEKVAYCGTLRALLISFHLIEKTRVFRGIWWRLYGYFDRNATIFRLEQRLGQFTDFVPEAVATERIPQNIVEVYDQVKSLSGDGVPHPA